MQDGSRRAIIAARASDISLRSTGYISASCATGTGRRVATGDGVGGWDVSARRALGTKTSVRVSALWARRPSARIAFPKPSTDLSRLRSS